MREVGGGNTKGGLGGKVLPPPTERKHARRRTGDGQRDSAKGTNEAGNKALHFARSENGRRAQRKGGWGEGNLRPPVVNARAQDQINHLPREIPSLSRWPAKRPAAPRAPLLRARLPNGIHPLRGIANGRSPRSEFATKERPTNIQRV